MLAKCPNEARVRRFRDFGKQKFFNVSFRAHSTPAANLRKKRKISFAEGA
jgi:hypothetical protein